MWRSHVVCWSFVIANSIKKEIGIMSSERDWKLFRKRLPEWQERCMQSLLNEYAAIIAAAESPSTKFWKLEKRLKQDVRRVGVQAEMSRSSMHFNLLCLLNEKVITMSDLDGFSEELVASLAEVYNHEREPPSRSLRLKQNNEKDTLPIFRIERP